MCKDPPPHKSKEDRAHPQACKAFQVLSPSFMLPQGFNKQLCRARRAVTLCARTHRLTRARRVAISPAHPQACKTFQVHSPPFMLPQGSYEQLCRARRAVTLCARTHRLKRARRVAVSPAHPQACKTFQVPSLHASCFMLHASTGILQTALQSAEGCHALCKDPPPHKSKEGRRLPLLFTSLQDLSGP